MKMKVKLGLFIVLALLSVILAFLILTNTFSSNSSSIGNPTVQEILKNDPNADILRLDDLVYLNVSNREDVNNRVYIKGEKIGEIKKTTNRTWWYRDLFASKLPKGSKVYTLNGRSYEKGDAPFIVLVERNNKILVYQSLREG